MLPPRVGEQTRWAGIPRTAAAGASRGGARLGLPLLSRDGGSRTDRIHLLECERNEHRKQQQVKKTFQSKRDAPAARGPWGIGGPSRAAHQASRPPTEAYTQRPATQGGSLGSSRARLAHRTDPLITQTMWFADRSRESAVRTPLVVTPHMVGAASFDSMDQDDVALMEQRAKLAKWVDTFASDKQSFASLGVLLEMHLYDILPDEYSGSVEPAENDLQSRPTTFRTGACVTLFHELIKGTVPSLFLPRCVCPQLTRSSLL